MSRRRSGRVRLSHNHIRRPAGGHLRGKFEPKRDFLSRRRASLCRVARRRRRTNKHVHSSHAPYKTHIGHSRALAPAGQSYAAAPASERALIQPPIHCAPMRARTNAIERAYARRSYALVRAQTSCGAVTSIQSRYSIVTWPGAFMRPAFKNLNYVARNRLP